MIIQKRDHSVVSNDFIRSSAWGIRRRDAAKELKRTKLLGWCLWETQPSQCCASLKTNVDKKEAMMRLSSRWKPYLASSYLVRNGQFQPMEVSREMLCLKVHKESSIPFFQRKEFCNCEICGRRPKQKKFFLIYFVTLQFTRLWT